MEDRLMDSKENENDHEGASEASQAWTLGLQATAACLNEHDM